MTNYSADKSLEKGAGRCGGEQLKGPVSIVTGAAGFLGSHLSEYLLNAGHSVVGIDALTDSYDPALKRRNVEGLAENSAFRFVHGDLVELDLEDLIRDATYVFHMAARAGVRGGWGAVFDAYVHDNILATQRLLEAMRVVPGAKKMVLASTSSAYGRDPPLPTPETTPLRPESYYAVTKVACEKLAEAYRFNFDVPVTTLRFYTLYGPRQRPDMAFHIFIRALLEDRAVTVYDDGGQTREVTYVTDAVEAVVRASQLETHGQVFNIGGGVHKTLNDYLADIERIASRTFRRESSPPFKGEQRHSRADITAAREVLGWAPSHPLDQGIREELHWIESEFS